jgi:hypothetical protein
MKHLTGGRIAGLYVGDSKGTVKRPVSSLLLTLDGIEGDVHTGRTQKTGAREPAFRRGTMVANTRQLSPGTLNVGDELEVLRAKAQLARD